MEIGGPDPNSLEITLASYDVGCTYTAYHNYKQCNAWRLDVLIPPELAHPGIIEFDTLDTTCWTMATPYSADDPTHCPEEFGGCALPGTLTIVAMDESSVQITINGASFGSPYLFQPILDGDYTAPLCTATH